MNNDLIKMEQNEFPEEDFEEFGKGLDNSNEEIEDAEQRAQELTLQGSNLGGIYELFGQVISQKDTIRICNLSREEMGQLPFSVRGSLYVYHLATTLKHVVFAAFFKNNAEIIQETSLSKDGFLISTFVTSKRYATSKNEDKPGPLQTQEPKKKKWKGMFSK